ncbi:MAG: hypothetical protein LQ351_006260 [Letrouitia transgressa]|nr:MAG: hypothetical protein LQ351_006260 [Letrouitia transgressa]
MRLYFTLALLIGLASARTNGCTSSTSEFDLVCYDSKDVLTRDVAIIGGGSSGTYGAIKILDAGKSVVVVEKDSLLGGHTETYTIPENGTKIDYGVLSYRNTSVVRDFFARFGIPITRFGGPLIQAKSVYTDFRTGQVFPKFAVSANLSAYSTQIDKYPYLDYGWDLPKPIPDDLLLTFGEFVEKYSLQDVAFTIYNEAAAGGLGNINEQLAVNVLKAVDRAVLEQLQHGSITTAHHNNQELYEKALAELGSNALLNSAVVAAERPTQNSSEARVKLLVKTPAGTRLVQASQILVTTTLQLDNMSPFNLDSREKGLFQQFNNTAYYCGLITNTGLPSSSRFVNVGIDNLYHIPHFPGLYFFAPTAVDGIFLFWYGSPNAVPEPVVRQEVISSVKILHNNSTAGRNSRPEILAFGNHTPYSLSVPPDAVRAGFYDDLNALQGYRSTWYTGAIFTPAAGTLWPFTQALLPKILAGT